MRTSSAEFRAVLEGLVPPDGRPIVVYSGLWQIGRSFALPFAQVPGMILDALRELCGQRRTLAMPTYTEGFKDGVLDLDSEPSRTGVLTEAFRKQPGVMRTKSAFFSYAAQGPDAGALSRLRPRDAWGDDSIFGWMEESDARMLMIGAPWDACSLKHRAELLFKVPYRYFKTFSGEIVQGGRREPLTERLFVRCLDPLVENDWSGVAALFSAAGMKAVSMGSGQVASMGARALLRAMRAQLERDPFVFCKDPDKVRRAFAV